VVTLLGRTASYGEKINAVIATKRVAGVLAVADDIEVCMPDFGFRSDADIAGAAANRINWSTQVPAGTVNLTVRDGHITLAGDVEWRYQKHAAEVAVHHLAGVKGVTNLITLRPTTAKEDIEAAIRSAFKRNILLDDPDIQVVVAANHVVLSGKVQSHTQSDEAERVAWAVPGVLSVDNHLKVEWFWDLAD